MTTKVKNVIAIQGNAPDTAGAIVYWRIQEWTSLSVLQEAWKNAGLLKELSPRQVSPYRAMTRAARELGTRSRFLRPLPQENGWAVVEETIVNNELAHQVVGSIKVANEQLEVTPYNAPWAQTARDAYEKYLGLLQGVDMSNWITGKLVPTLQAVALRDTGGIYFVPRQYIERYRTYAEVIKAASNHVLFEVPALRSEEAVEAVLDAVKRVAQNAVEQIEADLKDQPDLSARSLKVRAARCEKVLDIVKAYDELLGTNLAQLKKKIEDLQATVVEAFLIAETAADADKAA